jgi:hypothetical protein
MKSFTQLIGILAEQFVQYKLKQGNEEETKNLSFYANLSLAGHRIMDKFLNLSVHVSLPLKLEYSIHEEK